MGLQVGGKMTDQLETVCSACGRGIFAGRPRVWSRKPLGLCHPECVTAEQPEEATSSDD